MSKKTLVVYFSGTGGTEYIAKKISEHIENRGLENKLYSLDLSNTEGSTGLDYKDYECIFLLYPVYSFDAPRPIFEWIEGLNDIGNSKVAVVSVSGGGDVVFNKNCRLSCIKELEKKGIDVPYERMMVMPSNFAMKARTEIDMHLIDVVAERTGEIVEDMLGGKRLRTTEIKKKQWDKKSFGQKEHKALKEFGKGLHAGDMCNSCGWCEKNCPRNNIRLSEGKPIFGDECIMCMRCIYGCHSRAITPTKQGFAVLRDGYSIRNMIKQYETTELKPLTNCRFGPLWIGVKRYLVR